ncbi:MAG: hypothetical protein M3Y64_05200 [Gemmatimonadota bacterium]|nr:hypothetical protein [Gemmatimonadota bacterium]
MAQLTVKQYDNLEDAIAHGTRVIVWRRGTEFLIVPLRLRNVNRRECIDARHPSTGSRMTLWIDEIDAIEPVN